MIPTLEELMDYVSRKPKRNLNNFNHWIAEVRDLAEKIPMQIEGDYGFEVASRSDINWIFTKSLMENYFNDGLSPKEALTEEIDTWD